MLLKNYHMQVRTDGAEHGTIMATEMTLLRSAGGKTIVDTIENENMTNNSNTCVLENKE
jgi:hypothetical protein